VSADSPEGGVAPLPTIHNGAKPAQPTAGSSSSTPAKRPRARSNGEMPRVLLTKSEAAQALGMSVRHFERHVQRRLRCVHSGQLTLYPIRDIERWADEEATLGGRGAEGVR
jgi:hypothetical protein